MLAPRSGRSVAGGRLQLSLANLRATLAIVRGRFVRRQPLNSRFSALFFIWCGIGLLAAAVVVGLAFDTAASARVRDGMPGLSHAFGLITDVGLSGWYLVPAALLLLVANQIDWHRLGRSRLRLAYNWTSLAFLVLTAIGLSGIAVNVLKYGIARARPRLFDEVGPFSFDPFSFDAAYASFPSGHSTTMGAIAALVALLYPRARLAVIPAAFVVALSRVFVGAHYPSDVVAGFGFGFIFSLATAVLFARLGFIFRIDPAGSILRKRTFSLAPSGAPTQKRPGEITASI